MDSCKDILELNFNGWRLLHGSWKFQAIHCFSLPTDLPKGRRAKLCKIIHFVCKTDSPSGSGILKYCHCCPRPVICIAILMIIQGAAICICQMYPYAICHICNTGNPSLGNLSPPDAHLSSFPQAWCIVNPSLLDCFRNNIKTKFWSHIDICSYISWIIYLITQILTEKYSKARTICVTECISGSVWSICQSQINLSPHQAM